MTDIDNERSTEDWLNRAFAAAETDAEPWLNNSAELFSQRVQAEIATQSTATDRRANKRLRLTLLGGAFVLGAVVTLQLTSASDLGNVFAALFLDLFSVVSGGWAEDLSGSVSHSLPALPTLPADDLTPVRDWLTGLPTLLLVPALACAMWLTSAATD